MRKRGIALLCASLLASGLAAAVTPTAASGQPAPMLPPGGSYRTVGLARILDTRAGLGAPTGATQEVTVGTAGVAGIPTSGVSAVAVNLTVTDPAAAGSITAYAADTTRPPTYNANYVKGQTVGAMTIVPVDSTGRFTLYSSAKTQFVADVAGYFTTPQSAAGGGLFNAVPTATRIMDTRSHLGGAAPGPGGTTTLPVTGGAGVPANDVSAVVVNITVVGPTAAGKVTAYPAGIAPPNVSSLNFAAGEVRGNRAIVAVGQGGKIAFYNSAGTTQLTVDIVGYFTAGGAAQGSYYVARTPSRLLDTRTVSQGWSKSAGATNSLGGTVDGSGYALGLHRAPSVTDVAPTTSVWLTLTAVSPTTAGKVTAYASKTTRPATTDLNAPASTITRNATVVPVGTDGNVQIYSSAAEDLVVDIDGYFAQAPAVPTPAGLWAWGVSGYDDAFRVSSTPGLRAVVPGPVDFALGADGHLRGWNRPSFTNDTLRGGHGNLADGGGSVKQLVGSPGTTYALHTDGTVVAMGWNNYGQLGDGTQSNQIPLVDWSLQPPLTVGVTGGQTQISDVALVGAAGHNGYAVKTDGTVWSWGRSILLGTGATIDSYVPVQITGLSNVVSIAGNDVLTYAVDGDGHLWRWGNVPSSGGVTVIPTPQQVTTACAKGVSVAVDSYGAWELCDDGSVWQLYRFQQSTDTAVHLSGPGAVTAIAAAPSPGVQALNADGTVWRLPSVTATQFVQVYGLNGITAIGGGTYTSYAIR